MSDYAAALYQFARSLHQLDSAHLMDTIVRETSTLVDAPYVCLATFKPDLSLESAIALNADSTAQLWTTLLAAGVVGFAYHSRRTVVIRNLSTDPRWVKAPGVPQTGSAIALPLYRNQEPYGVLMLLHNQVDYFDTHRVGLLEELSRIAETALANALEYEHLRYNGLFDEAVVPLIMTDLDGFIIDLNREAALLLGCERGDILGCAIDLVHPIDAEALHVSQLRTIQPGEEVTFRTVARRTRGGADIPVVVRMRRRNFRGRDVIELIEQDITTEMKLEQLRRDLTAMVYHDLRNPLQNVDISIQRLSRMLANHENPVIWTLLQTGVRSARQLRRMIDSLLDVQRMEEGKSVLDLQSVEMRTVIADAVQSVQPVAVEANIRLKFEIALNIPTMCLDADMVTRVLINLLENAIKYTPEGGVVAIKADTTAAGKEVKVLISDSGPGIPKHMQTQIFDKFSRVKYQSAPKGVGLGLAFCRLAIEAHGGEIWVESEPGHGSDFIFTLPVVTESEPAPAANSKKNAAAR